MNDLSRYRVARPRIGTGDLIEWRSESVLGYTIRWVTRRDVNHSSLALKLERFDGALNRRWTLEALEHGITLNLLSRRLSKFKGRVYWSALRPEYDLKRLAIAGWALQKVGIKYDYGSLFKNVMGAVSVNARRMFCSEYYFLALRAAGIVAGDKSPRPGEFGEYGIHHKRIQIL